MNSNLRSLFCCTALALLVQSSPTSTQGKRLTTNVSLHSLSWDSLLIVVNKFDKIADGDIVPNPTDGLKFQGFTARSRGVSPLTPPSTPNYAVTRQLSNEINNLPTPIIAAGPGITSFSLESIYVGCVQPGTGTVSDEIPPLPVDVPVVDDPPPTTVPVSCNVRFEGTNVNGQSIAHSCSFVGLTSLSKCDFGSDLSKAKELQVKGVDLLGTDKVLTVLLDDAVHTNYKWGRTGDRKAPRGGLVGIQHLSRFPSVILRNGYNISVLKEDAC